MFRFGLALIMLIPIGAAAAVEISDVAVTEPFFSPNNDGVQDLTGVTFTITSDEVLVSLWVTVTDQAGVPVKTLAEAEIREPGGVHKIWDGSKGPGQPAPEGVYYFEITVIAGPSSDGPKSATVVLDITPPGFTILLYPNPYAPAVPLADSVLTVEMTTMNSEPEDWLSMWISVSEEPETLCTQQAIYGDSTYSCTWDGRDEQDGVYGLSARLWDRAGNANQGSYSVDLDLAGPVITIESPSTTFLDSFPSAISGTAGDRNGVEWIGVRFADDMDYSPTEPCTSGTGVPSWCIDWPETLDSDGTYNIQVAASDSVGYESTKSMAITIDTTPPSTPSLSSLPETVSRPELAVSGTCSSDDSVIVYVNDRIGAKVSCTGGGTFSVTVELDLGANTIYAVGKDVAGRLSDPSDAVIVNYEEAIGISVPEKLQAGSKIEANLAGDADEIRLTVFSLDGYHVSSVIWTDPPRFSELEWDLLDADGREVSNGVYLLVFEIRYTDGTEDIEKRLVVIAR
jgi:hypothetical protein